MKPQLEALEESLTERMASLPTRAYPGPEALKQEEAQLMEHRGLEEALVMAMMVAEEGVAGTVVAWDRVMVAMAVGAVEDQVT